MSVSLLPHGRVPEMNNSFNTYIFTLSASSHYLFVNNIKIKKNENNFIRIIPFSEFVIFSF